MPTDKLQANIEVGSIVNIPCVITAIGGTQSQPTLTLQTQYKGFDGNVDTISPVLDPIQVTLKE